MINGTRLSNKMQIKYYRDRKRLELRDRTGLSLRDQKLVRGTIRVWRKHATDTKLRSIYALFDDSLSLNQADRDFKGKMFSRKPLSQVKRF